VAIGEVAVGAIGDREVPAVVAEGQEDREVPARAGEIENREAQAIAGRQEEPLLRKRPIRKVNNEVSRNVNAKTDQVAQAA
jgi:hypothetical protein